MFYFFFYVFASLFSLNIIYTFCRRILLRLFPEVIQNIISIIFKLLRLFSNSSQGMQLFIRSNVSCSLLMHYFIRLSVYLPSRLFLLIILLFSLYPFYSLLDCVLFFMYVFFLLLYFFILPFLFFIRN